jgi:hypothetical protein
MGDFFGFPNFLRLVLVSGISNQPKGCSAKKMLSAVTSKPTEGMFFKFLPDGTLPSEVAVPADPDHRLDSKPIADSEKQHYFPLQWRALLRSPYS